MVNRAIIVGYLGQDPDIRTARTGTKIANLSVATSNKWRDRESGERKESTQWHRVVVFNQDLVEVARAMKKGSHVYVAGSMETRVWEPSPGDKKYISEIVLRIFGGELCDLGRGGGSGDLGQSDHDYSESGQQDSGGGPDPETSSPGRAYRAPRDLDDDIPF